MSENSKQPRWSFSDESKRDAVDLVIQQGDSSTAAPYAVGFLPELSESGMRNGPPEAQSSDEDASIEPLREEIYASR